MIKTLHYVQSIEPLQGGGLGQAALGLHLALREHAESTLVSTRASGFSDPSPGVRLYERMGPAPLYFSPSMFRDAEGLVREVDWLHSHGCYTATQAAFGLEGVRQSRPMVYHPHGFFDPWILGRARFKKGLVRWLFEDKNFRNVRIWRALTRKEESQITSLGFTQPVMVVPNGIRLEEIDQATSDEDEKVFEKRLRPKRALFLGRLHPKKGLDILIPVWGKVAKEFPDWELAIVGPDEGGYLATVREMIRDSGAADSIQVFGSVRGSRKVAAFRSSDLFVLSSYSEGFPVAIVEAAAHRLPCVITTECNFSELVEADGGWESLPTKESVLESLKAALGSDDLALKQRGANGRKLVEAGYTWPVIARRMHDACVALM